MCACKSMFCLNNCIIATIRIIVKIKVSLNILFCLFQLVMAAKMPELNYSCEICGADGLSDEEMRLHIVLCHLKGAASCPFCDLEDVSPEEMLSHVNSAHLDYLTPERELFSFIDDEDSSERHEDISNWTAAMKPHNGLTNNINNNNINSYCDLKIENEGASGWSPRRSQLVLNLSGRSTDKLKTPGTQKCPMCTYCNDNTAQLEEHINRKHFDLTSPSFPVDSSSGSYNCPLCAQTFLNASDLELHVNIEHKDILSPGKVRVYYMYR